MREDLHRVISVKSTASKVAAYCGQPSDVTFRLFDLPEALHELVEGYLRDMDSVRKVSHLQELFTDPPPTPEVAPQRLASDYASVILSGGNRLSPWMR